MLSFQTLIEIARPSAEGVCPTAVRPGVSFENFPLSRFFSQSTGTLAPESPTNQKHQVLALVLAELVACEEFHDMGDSAASAALLELAYFGVKEQYPPLIAQMTDYARAHECDEVRAFALRLLASKGAIELCFAAPLVEILDKEAHPLAERAAALSIITTSLMHAEAQPGYREEIAQSVLRKVARWSPVEISRDAVFPFLDHYPECVSSEKAFHLLAQFAFGWLGDTPRDITTVHPAFSEIAKSAIKARLRLACGQENDLPRQQLLGAVSHFPQLETALLGEKLFTEAGDMGQDPDFLEGTETYPHRIIDKMSEFSRTIS